MNHITENALSPAVAVPVGSATLAASLISSLPIIINVLVGIYFVLMVGHKAYQFWKEVREDMRKKRASRK